MEVLYRPLSSPETRTLHILNLSKSSFRRWMQDCGSTSSIKTVMQGREQTVDSFDKELIRREICRMFDMNETVTLRKLRIWLKRTTSKYQKRHYGGL
jgi:hypothetical protein